MLHSLPVRGCDWSSNFFRTGRAPRSNQSPPRNVRRCPPPSEFSIHEPELSFPAGSLRPKRSSQTNWGWPWVCKFWMEDQLCTLRIHSAVAIVPTTRPRSGDSLEKRESWEGVSVTTARCRSLKTVDGQCLSMTCNARASPPTALQQHAIISRLSLPYVFTICPTIISKSRQFPYASCTST